MKEEKIIFSLLLGLMLLFSGSILFLKNTNIITGTTIATEEELSVEANFCYDGSCPTIIAGRISNSTNAKCALYDITNTKVKNALNDKKTPTIIEAENYEHYTNSIKDKNKALMHNKFCVIDEKTVITGSYNPTKEQSNDNMLIINSPTIARAYEIEWNELKKNIFTAGITTIKNKNTTITILFCPEDNCSTAVQKELKNAKKSIHFLTYRFTDKEIINMLSEKTKTISVEGITDNKEDAQQIQNAGIPVKEWKGTAILHHKLFIIDGEIVITGSYNPTKNGDENNNENIAIVKDLNIAEKYEKEYERIKLINK